MTALRDEGYEQEGCGGMGNEVGVVIKEQHKESLWSWDCTQAIKL